METNKEEKKSFMTLQEHLDKAIEELELSIDTFPDKTDDIRRDNSIIYGVIEILKAINE